MSKVFISYGSKNKVQAERLCAYLEERGIPCWIAPRDISAGIYAGEITRAVKAADVFIVLCSKDTRFSDHVKNEVNLAVRGSRLILPYCLDERPFDDDLEYYLSSKQRIVASGDSKKDFAQIERIIRDQRGEHDAVGTPLMKERTSRPVWPYVLVCLVLAVGVLFYLMQRGPSSEHQFDRVNPADTTIVEESSIRPASDSVQTVLPKAKAAPQPDPDADTFTGSISDGCPDGYGIYTFKKRRRIDMHDPQERYAEEGDYIEGSWTRGHLNYGEWYAPDGTKKGFIELGDQPDTDRDKLLGRCVKP